MTMLSGTVCYNSSFRYSLEYDNVLHRYRKQKLKAFPAYQKIVTFKDKTMKKAFCYLHTH
jgi:hypothetical protein